ncbi:MAG: hypothetical protein ACLRWQ_13120 [Flavonifractor plautii]
MWELRGGRRWHILQNAWYQSIDYVRTVWLSLGDLVPGGAVSSRTCPAPSASWSPWSWRGGRTGGGGRGGIPVLGRCMNIF